MLAPNSRDVMAQNTATTAEEANDNNSYAFRVCIDGQALATVRSRHAAVGCACIWNHQYDTDAEATIEAVPHHNENDLPGLTDEPAREDA